MLSAVRAESPSSRAPRLDLALHEALCWVRLEVHLKAAADGLLTANLGNLLRGTFGAALHQISASVYDRAPTAYQYLFETRRPPDAGVLRSNVEVPRPFVLRPPAARRSVRRGELLEFELLLIGRALDYLPEAVAALQLLGQHGLGPQRVPFMLRGLWQRFATRRPALLYDGATVAGDPVPERLAPRPADVERYEATLDFVTPARIVVDGHPVARALPCRVLVRALLRRISSLAAFHGGGPLALDFGALIERARGVEERAAWIETRTDRRWSARQIREIENRGIVGRVRYAGAQLPSLMPIIRLGAELHVGKGTVLGSGNYRIAE